MGSNVVQTRRIMAIDKIISLAMYGIAASAVAEVVGMPLASLLAVGGISGIAVGFAAKEVISNMFGGASLFLTRPFVIGEKIKVSKFSWSLLALIPIQSMGYQDFVMKMIIEKTPASLE
jgi:small-conductance mechanosensitive channel